MGKFIHTSAIQVEAFAKVLKILPQASVLHAKPAICGISTNLS